MLKILPRAYLFCFILFFYVEVLAGAWKFQIRNTQIEVPPGELALEKSVNLSRPWICNLGLLRDRQDKLKIKSVAYSSQGSHTGQLDFCNWLADGSTTG